MSAPFPPLASLLAALLRRHQPLPLPPRPNPAAAPLSPPHSKLEQELATLRERAQASGAKNRSGLEALRGRLAAVERAVEARAVESQRRLVRVREQVQHLAAAAMPLAVAAAAAAAPPGRRPAGAAAAQQGRGGAPPAARGQPATAPRPLELQQRFSQVRGGRPPV